MFPSDFYKMFLFISPCFSLEGISPIFTVEGTEAQTSLMPVQESKWFSSVQLLSRVWLFATPWIAACQASLSITNSWNLLKLMPIELVMQSSHLILCRPLLLLPPIPPCIRAFSNESALCMRCPKYWSFSFSISPSNEHPGLISFQWTPRTEQPGLVGSPCSPRDSQESSPTPWFKSINSSELRFLHSPTLTSIHDHWKNYSLDQSDLCWQSNVFAF